MWFALGIVTLVAITVGIAWWRWDVDWKGEPLGAGRFKLHAHKGKVQFLRVGVASGVAVDFELKPEGWFDRLGKSVGVAVEPQANRRSFDDSFYVLSDDERLVRALRLDPELLSRLEGIGRARVGGFRFHRLVCRRGQLWIVFKPEGKPEGHLEASSWAVQELLALAAALPVLPPGQSHVGDRTVLYAVLLLALSSALALNGGVHLFRIMAMGYLPFTVDTAQLWSLAVVVAAVLLLALALATLFLLGRSSRAHLVLLQVLLLGGLGAAVTSFVELRDLNMEADRGKVQEFATVVQGKHYTTHRTRRGGTSHNYYLELSDWARPGATYDLEVDSSTYNARYLTQPLVVRQHPGFLGVRWVESVEPQK
jgi:hypothetical protein